LANHQNDASYDHDIIAANNRLCRKYKLTPQEINTTLQNWETVANNRLCASWADTTGNSNDLL